MSIYYIFNASGELVAESNVIPDENDLTNRGEFFLHSSKRLEGLITGDAKSQTIEQRPFPPSIYHYWDGSNWALDDAGERAWLKDEQRAALATLNANAADYVEKVVHSGGIPSFEQATWPLQSAEAAAWVADASQPTPLLDAIATARGVAVDLLRAKAHAKSQAYQKLTGVVCGQRQKIEDAIWAAVDRDILASIDLTIDGVNDETS